MSPFTALSDPTRRRILELLRDGEQSAGTLVTTLATEAGISQPAVSQHLRVLREAGLVRVRPVGSHRLYSLEPRQIEATTDWLSSLVAGPAPFDQALDALATEVVRGRRSGRGIRPDAATG